MVKQTFVAAVILAAALPGFGAQPAPADMPWNGDSIALEINGVKFTLSEMERQRPAAMFQARSNYYEAARRSLEEYAQDYLLEQQARKEHLTVPELLERHVNNAIASDPGEETLRVYYETADTTESYESVRVKAHRRHPAETHRQSKDRISRIDPTSSHRRDPPRAAARAHRADRRAVRGPANPRVLLTEFADYECPYCQQVQPTIEKLEAEFKGKLAFTYKDFPLPMHPNAQKAAEASRCAQAQGKYWEFHDLLASTKQLELPALKAHARQLKLDASAFDKCLDTGDKAEVVKAQANEATALGLQGTPTFFINGRYISGALSYEHLRDVILEELSAGDARAPAQSGRVAAQK